MPSRAPRVCGLCNAVHPPGQRCPISLQRERERKARADAQRPSASARGYDREWTREAAAYLRLNPVCTCGAPAVLVRHRISIRLRPDLRMDKSNWLPGCRKCNAADLRREQRASPGGQKVSDARGYRRGEAIARFDRNRNFIQ